MLLARGADIEHVDRDVYSVLSYFWVVDGPSAKSVGFMRLCLSKEFSEVNACDSRGWSGFQTSDCYNWHSWGYQRVSEARSIA